MTTARTKAATTSASFGTRILTQCIPGLVSGGCAESNRDARECGLKTRGLRSTLDMEAGKFYQALGKTCGPDNLAYIASESAFCISARPPYNARRQHGSCVLQSVHSCLPGARGQRPAAGRSCCLCVRQSNQASAVAFSCEVCRCRRRDHISDSSTRCSRLGNPRHQECHPRTEPLYLPGANRIRQPAQAGQTKSALTFRPRFNGEALASARFSCLARSCASTSIDLPRTAERESIIPPCTRSCVSRPALRPPSFA